MTTTLEGTDADWGSAAAAAALPAASRRFRPVYRGFGYAFAAVGVAGIALPLLPTTGPWILAVWLLVKGGDPLAVRLLDHPRFGRGLREWFVHGRISRTGKIAASLGMGMGCVAAALFGLGGVALTALAAVLAGLGCWLWSRPSGR